MLWSLEWVVHCTLYIDLSVPLKSMPTKYGWIPFSAHVAHARIHNDVGKTMKIPSATTNSAWLVCSMMADARLYTSKLCRSLAFDEKLVFYVTDDEWPERNWYYWTERFWVGSTEMKQNECARKKRDRGTYYTGTNKRKLFWRWAKVMPFVREFV